MVFICLMNCISEAGLFHCHSSQSFSPADIVASFERRQGGCCCGAAVQESSIDTAEQLKEASVKGFTDDAHLADLVRQLIASMNE